MLVLYLIGFVAGLITGISPCILPVLPVILVAGATGTSPGAISGTSATTGVVAPARRYRAYAVIAGLVVSFSAFTLVGSWVLSSLGLPQDLLRDTGLVVLGLVGVGLLVPVVGHLLERPFTRLVRRQPTGNAGALVLGLGLGVVFVPCAGPVLAAITVLGATHRVGFTSVVFTVDFALGAAVPLLALALAGQHVGERVSVFKAHAVLARRIGGIVLLTMTILIALHVTDPLQRAVPGYTNALQQRIEANSYARRQLAALTGTAKGNLSNCASGVSSLEQCGPAPTFTGISHWLNTQGDQPVTLANLHGKVALIDFWTYSCINCQRALPHVEGWYRAYHGDGFVVVGVHTPEFAFEHVVSNVTQADQQLGVRYPVAIDNGYKTWNAYSNQYWPAEYLIDADGNVRHVNFGEGDYGITESLIRQLLVKAHPTLHLPPRTDVVDRTPMKPTTPESYLGYNHLQNFAGTQIVPDKAAHYEFPAVLPANELSFSGTWTVGAENATAGPSARLELDYQATDVHLVMGGSGTVGVTVNGVHTETLSVSGIPRLYTVVRGSSDQMATLVLSVSPGVDAYDFTFG